MKLPLDTVIAREKITAYLLVRQSRGDKAAFLMQGGFTIANPDSLIAELRGLQLEGEAEEIDNNMFGRYYEITGVLRQASNVGLRVKTIWMTEHLSGATKFITLIPIEIVHP